MYITETIVDMMGKKRITILGFGEKMDIFVVNSKQKIESLKKISTEIGADYRSNEIKAKHMKNIYHASYYIVDMMKKTNNGTIGIRWKNRHFLVNNKQKTEPLKFVFEIGAELQKQRNKSKKYEK